MIQTNVSTVPLIPTICYNLSNKVLWSKLWNAALRSTGTSTEMTQTKSMYFYLLKENLWQGVTVFD